MDRSEWLRERRRVAEERMDHFSIEAEAEGDDYHHILARKS